MSKLVPTWYYKTITTIPLKMLYAKGYRTILCDLDNTLAPFFASIPTAESRDFINAAVDAGFKFYVISNNHVERVELFCRNLAVEFAFDMKKPLIKRFIKFINDKKIDITKAIIIGDQLLTDVWLSKRLHCASILVEPAVEKDLIVTKLNRFFDKQIRRKYQNKGLLKGVEEDE